jgi:hypothetical protein
MAITVSGIANFGGPNGATFLGKKLNGNYQDEMGTRYNVRIEGTRARHSMGISSIKRYGNALSGGVTSQTFLHSAGRKRGNSYIV